MTAEPYVGPRPFTLDDRERFFGRKDDTDEAVSLVMAYPVVLIYALSGVGKSSLVNAGLVPLLREEGFTVLPPARVEGVLPAGIERASIANEYVFHALSCWLDEQSVPFNHATEITGLRLLAFVDAWLAVRPEKEQESAPVLIFDQFEEIFTGHEARWKERDEFFAQVGEALAKHPELKAVFTLREEFIARLEPFAGKFPRGLRVRKRLERLREDAARAAITRPVELFGVRYDEGVAEKLVHDLLGVGTGEGGMEVLGEFVEPVQLQVVCRNLWDKLPADFKQQAVPGTNRKPAERLAITQAHLDAAGEVTTALSNYYNEALQAALQTCEIPEGQLRRWFGETLIAGDGAGLGMGVVGQGETEAIPELAVRALQERYLVRHEKRGAAEWFELSHARFIKPILKSNAAWLEARSGPAAMRGKLLQRAEELSQSGGSLEEWELGQAEDFLKSPEARELGDRSEIEAMVLRSREQLREEQAAQERELKQRAVADLQAKQLAHNQRAIRFRNILLTLLALMSVAALIAYGVAKKQKGKAEQQTAVATQQTQVSKARELAFRAVDAIREDPERALLLALYSYSTTATPEGASAWHQSLVASSIRLRLAGENGHRDPKTGKPCSVLSAAYSRDGRQILTAGLDHEVRIWDAEKGDFLGKLGEDDQQAADWVWSVAFSPDGSKVASASRDGKVRIWPYPKPASGPWPAPVVLPHFAIQNGKPVTVHSVAFDPAGTRIVTSCHDGTARVWDLATQREIVRLLGHVRPIETFVRAGSFSPAAPNLVITAAQDNTAKLWSLEALPPVAEGVEVPVLTEPLRTFRAKAHEEQGMWDAEFSPDGRLLLTAGGDHFVTLWDVATGLVLAETEDHANAVIAAKFIDDQTAVSVGIDKTVRLWSIERLPGLFQPGGMITTASKAEANVWRHTLTAKGVLRGHTDFLRNVDIAPDRRRLVTCSRDGTARVWQMPPTFEVAALRTAGIVWDVAFSPDGKHAVTAAGTTPTVWGIENFATEPQPRLLPNHSEIVKCVAWSTDGKLIASASARTVRICDAATGAEVNQFAIESGAAISSIAFHPKEHLLAVAAGKDAVIWNGGTFALDTFTVSRSTVFAVSFSPDGTRLLTAGTDRAVRAWDWKARRAIAKSHDHDDIVLDAGYSPDGKLIVTAGADGNIAVLNSDLAREDEKGATPPPEILRGHEGQVRKARFFSIKDARGDRLAILSAGFDTTVRIWEVNPITNLWTQTSQLPGASGAIYAIACSGDGTQIITGGADKVGRVYYRDAEWLFKLATSRVTRDLTDDEKARYEIALKKE